MLPAWAWPEWLCNLGRVLTVDWVQVRVVGMR